MIKQRGNIKKALAEFKDDKTNSIAFLYKEAFFAKGPLEQATVTLKDVFATRDAPTQGSSRLLKGFKPGYDATVVQKLKNTGAAIVAKVHSDELALGGTGSYSGFGKINNPLDKTRMPGGSSSGSIATLSNNISLAIASDTGDSVRLPASYGGKVGFKPSYGAVSRYGMTAFASSLDTVGWLTHNVDDATLAAKVLFGPDERDMTSVENIKLKVKIKKPKHVAVLSMSNVLTDFIDEEFNSLVKKLQDQGIVVEKVSVDLKLLESIGTVYEIIAFSEASSNNANLTGVSFGNQRAGKNWADLFTNTRSEGFGSMAQRRFALGAFYLLAENQEDVFVYAQKVRRLIAKSFSQIYNSYDLLIYPTASIAPKWVDGKEKNWYSSFLSHSNFTGNPSISIPWTKEHKMPVNLSLDSKIYDDQNLLSYALYFEKLIGGQNNE